MGMKKLMAIALVMVLAFSLLTACSVSTGSDKDGGGSTPTLGSNGNSGGDVAPGSLAALEKAAVDAGYTDIQDMSYISNDKLAEPLDGFTIGIKDDKGSTVYGIEVNEFASEEDAQKYTDYVIAEPGFGNIHKSGKFCVNFAGKAAKNEESKILAVFTAAGWNFD
jgi:hypothetical protein